MEKNVKLYPTVLIIKDQIKLATIQNAIHKHNKYSDNFKSKEYFQKHDIFYVNNAPILKIEILGIGESVRSVLEKHPDPKCIIIESTSINGELEAWQSISKHMGLPQKSKFASNFQKHTINDFNDTSQGWKDVLHLIYGYAGVHGYWSIEVM